MSDLVARTASTPFVTVRKGETIHSAIARHRSETGHTGWCIVTRRRRKAAA